MSTPKVWLAAVMAAAVFAAGPVQAPQSVSLISIAKDSPSVQRTVSRLQIDVRQELETCFLAFADRDDMRGLRRERVRFKVIDRKASGREYFLLPVAAGDRSNFERLAGLGQAVPVEPGTALFWSERADVSSLLPPELPRKALPDVSILPYLKAAPAAAVQALTAVQDPAIEAIAAEVSAANMMNSIQTLQDFGTRYASTAACEAAGDFLYGYFMGLGLDDVRFESFSFSGYASRNVIATKTGSTYPEDYYIVCSHYDSTSGGSTRLTNAPGADDNASGTAAVMEAARVLASRELDFSVRFVAFSAEEWGLYGSQAYAAAAAARGERIHGVINLDMIAYADAMPEDLELIVNSYSQWLAERLRAAANAYAGLAARKIVNASFTYSDHAPFWDRGYVALLGIEDEPIRNPYYHTTNDRLDTLNMTFCRGSAAAALALLAELAQPVRLGYPRTPVGVEAAASTYRSLFNALKTARLSWSPQSDAVGFNIYRSTVSHLNYAKLNEVPVTGLTFDDPGIDISTGYYYAVSAVGPGGLESYLSKEAVVPPSVTLNASVLSGLLLRPGVVW
jgi:hypothetical protein